MSIPSPSMDLGFAPDPTRPEEKEGTAAAGHVGLSAEQFQQLLSTVTERREADYAAALSGQEMPAPPAEDLSLDFSNLPDPRFDMDGFKAGLAQQLGHTLSAGRDQIMQAARSESQSAIQREQTINRAWDMLRDSHPDLAEHSDLITTAANNWMTEMSTKGRDPIAVLSADMERHVEAIAGRVQSTVDRIRGFQSGNGEGDHDRTDMLGAGPGRSRSPAAKRSSTKDEGDFTKELMAAQREAGIYR